MKILKIKETSSFLNHHFYFWSFIIEGHFLNLNLMYFKEIIAIYHTILS